MLFQLKKLLLFVLITGLLVSSDLSASERESQNDEFLQPPKIPASKSLPQKRKRNFSEEESLSPASDTSTQTQGSCETTNSEPKRVKKCANSRLKRISSLQDHLKLLQNSIKKAQNSLLITSYGVSGLTLKENNLGTLLADARERGVSIHIYSTESKKLDTETEDFFNTHDIHHNICHTHAKILAVDDKKVSIGSYNWLACHTDWENATLCWSGIFSASLVPLLLDDLTYYQDRHSGNFSEVTQYESNPENYEMDEWYLGEQTTLQYLHTLDAHKEFIKMVFKKSPHKIIFCTSFFHEKSGYTEDFNKKILTETLARKVNIYFVFGENEEKLASFKKYLKDFLSSEFLHILFLPTIHLKTIISDDEVISEGSFNWLSASRDKESIYHNYEASFVVNGWQAKQLIQDFNDSYVGQQIAEVSLPQKRNPKG